MTRTLCAIAWGESQFVRARRASPGLAEDRPLAKLSHPAQDVAKKPAAIPAGVAPSDESPL